VLTTCALGAPQLPPKPLPVLFDFFPTLSLTSLLDIIDHLSKSSQLGITAGIIIAALLLHRAVSGGILRKTSSLEAARAIIIRGCTLITAVVGVCLVALWSNELKSAMLTLAALGAAAILALKEILVCWLGSIYRATAGVFDVGDTVEVNGVRGEVVDVGAISFTLMELGTTFQATGRSLEMPNGLLFLHPVRNLSQPGPYVVHFARVCVAVEDGVLEHRRALLAAATDVCCCFQDSAAQSLESARRKMLANTPSATPTIALEPKDHKAVDLVLRFPCPRDGRVRTEQEILTRYYAGLSAAKAGKAAEGDQPNT
jgi:small-conductance mechanosensitive channel